MVFPKFFLGYFRLFFRIIRRIQNIFTEPLIAARSREHTAHQMVAAVCVRKGVQRIIGIDTKFF